MEQWTDLEPVEQRFLLSELWYEGEIRLHLATDEYDPIRHMQICAMEAAGLVKFSHNVENSEGGIDQILTPTDAGNQLLEEFDSTADDLHVVAANVCIGFAATWQVEAAAEIEALASAKGVKQLSRGVPKQFRNSPEYRDWMDKLMQMSGTGG